MSIQERWDAGAPERAARLEAMGKAGRVRAGLIGFGGLAFLVALAVVAVFAVGAFLWVAWKPLVGFAIAFVLIAAVSIGIRR